ncbi:MAG TPA: hypothetical protein VFJ55_05655 [Chthoniobacterales bacterium]|nr:hypothetical protein [Chthoniobacterales bacterium]
MSLRAKAIAEYHQLLIRDTDLSPSTFKKLRTAMRRDLLVYGDRPIGVALRPHLLEESQFRLLTRHAESLASAFEKIAAAAVESPTLMDELGLTETERKLAVVNPGFSPAAITSRIDGFVHGKEIKFVEYNAENPSSLSDQEGLNRVLSDLPAMAAFAKGHALRQFSPVEQLLDALLMTYRDWGGVALPNIAIVDWEDVPTANEFVLLRDYFQSRGVRTIICSPHSLEYAGRKLWSGNFPIDLIYKRIIIHELLGHYGEDHPLVQAYMHRDVCMVNPFRSKIMHKKASFEPLTDEARQNWFTIAEQKAIRQSIPWTRRLRDDQTRYGGKKVELLKFVSQQREQLVIKPNDDYGGRGIHIGSRLTEKEWDGAIETGLSEDYVVQEAVTLHPEEFPIFSDDKWGLQPMFVDTNPFLFRGKVCGAMVRLSSSPIVNVTSGGGETGFFVLAS